MNEKGFNIIKNDGPADLMVWKANIEDFNTCSQIIVHEGQEAVFFKEGQMLDSFGSGRHELKNENIPLIRKWISKMFGSGNKTPFSCEIYYVNLKNIMDIYWGTDSPIPLEDPKYKLLVGVRANGQTAFQITNARVFLVDIVGKNPQMDKMTLKSYFKGLLMSRIKDQIAKVMIDDKVSFLEVTSKMRHMSEVVEKDLNYDLDKFGFKLVNFTFNSISVSDSDYAKLKEYKEELAKEMAKLDVDVEKTVRMAKAVAEARAAQGFTYQEERQFDVLEGAAKNEGAAGTIIGAGMGLGMGVGVGAATSKMVNQNLNSQTEIKCSKCGATMASNAKFCNECGTPVITKIKCPNCNAELPSNAKFCNECGTPIKATKNCPECGVELPSNAKFCNECGHRF